MVDFWKRPHMKNPSAPARSLDRDGKVSYITFLQMSSLTRRKQGQKIEVYSSMWAPHVPRGTPAQPNRTPKVRHDSAESALTKRTDESLCAASAERTRQQ